MEQDIFKHHWYSLNAVKYEIAKQCQFREVIFLDKTHEKMPVRCIFAYKADHLQRQFDEFKFMQFKYNLYLSVAQFKGTPLFSYNFAERRKQMDEFSGYNQKPTYPDYWQGYDFFMDFDSPDLKDIEPALKDCHLVKDTLDHYNVPYVLSFSGSKGFHLRIPYAVLPQSLGLGIVTFCKILGENIKERLKLDTLDIGVFDERRIFKAPYSYDNGNICLPLSDEQFEKFDIRQMAVKNVLNNVKIFNRGVLMRFPELPLERSRENFHRMWRDFK